MSSSKEDIVRELIVAYWMEFETVMNYVSNSINLQGVRSEEIKKVLAADVQEELTHAQTLARRIHELEGIVPGSLAFHPCQKSMQPLDDPTDLAAVIRGVIEAEEAAIAQYNKLIKMCDGVDYVTQDLCIQALASEETHRREFIGYLADYQ